MKMTKQNIVAMAVLEAPCLRSIFLKEDLRTAFVHDIHCRETPNFNGYVK